MSKTDSTQPYWLREFYASQIAHDHRHGVCKPESFADARAGAHGASWRHTSRQCDRFTVVETPCPGHLECRVAARTLNDNILRARADHDFFALRGLFRFNAHRPFTCRLVHRTSVFSPNVFCAGCVARAERPTCMLRGLPAGEGSARNMKPNVRRLREKQARSQTRAALRAAAKEFNADGDTDCDPVPTRHRHFDRYWWGY